ncbi:MAG: L-histidine N(alpha)-methyltransferase [Zetaproteobacteria bacterium]|nr:L-histidine N(alpha)-methyltransferase [Zetaproteobacteria bacterium]
MEIIRLNHASVQDEKLACDQFAVDVLTGLCSTPKKISSKYFYNDLGSKLFQQITHHEDYYLTRIEHAILSAAASEIPQHFTHDAVDIVELGVGDGHKTKLIIDGFLSRGIKVQFFPVDISAQAMLLLEKNYPSHPKLNIFAIVGEYLDALKYLRDRSMNPQLLLFLGSNIGNFDRVQNQGFLSLLRRNMQPRDRLLIGFDLKKDVQVLTRAYNDSAGITREFNLNILRRINEELGANFCLHSWDHFGSYNPILGAMESFLLPDKPQEVYIAQLQRSFSFAAYEPIHLEYSFKYLMTDIDFLCCNTGFVPITHYQDEQRWFVDSLWQPEADENV